MKYFSHEFEQASWWEDVNTTVYDFTNKSFWLFNIMQHLKNNNNEIIYIYVIHEYVTLVISKIIWNVYTVIKSCPYAFKGLKVPIMNKNMEIWAPKCFRKYFTTVWPFQNLPGFVWKTTQAWLCGKSCFSHTNSSIFRQPL